MARFDGKTWDASAGWSAFTAVGCRLSLGAVIGFSAHFFDKSWGLRDGRLSFFEEVVL